MRLPLGVCVCISMCSLNNQVAEDKMGGPVARIGEKRNAYRLLVGKPEGK
jgi:hypothetical protein